MISWELVIISSIGGLSAVVGALIGAIIAPRLNHNYSLKRLSENHRRRINYMKEEAFFKKKLEYFERITEAIEDNILFCNIAISRMKSFKTKKDWEKVIDLLERSKILQMQGSPLYSDNLKPTAIGITKFLMAWEEIITLTRNIPKRGNLKNLIEKLEKLKKRMMDAGKETVEKMRKELKSNPQQ